MASTVLNIDDKCRKKNNPDLDLFYAKWFGEFSSASTALPQMFMRRYQQVTYGADIGTNEICKHNLKTGAAVVKFQLATQSVTQIEKKIRVQQADYISNIGTHILILIPLRYEL